MKRLFFLIPLLALSACKKDKEITEPITNVAACIEGTYCFRDGAGSSTVDYSGQTVRLNQLTEMGNYIKARIASGEVIEASVLSEMFSNNEGNGSLLFSEEARSAGKQLKDKCFLPLADSYSALFAAIEAASASGIEGQNGTAGVLSSTADPSRSWLFDENGREPLQLIEKGLMGDVFYYQALHTYLMGTEDDNFDNEAIVSGKNYTEAEHKFDEAFGYLGVPVDFLTNPSEARFHGRYSNSRNSALDTSSPIFNAFRDVRGLIAANDRNGVVEGCTEIRRQWHRVIAGTAIHYLKQAIANQNDPAVKCHVLSEAHAFIGNLRYGNDDWNLTADEIDAARALLGNNYYETTETQISDCILYLLDRTAITLDELALL